MIYLYGDIFKSPAQVIVNTVNTVGVMGKGIALTFKNLYPDMYKEYKRFCENKALSIGKLYLYKTPGKWILNFPTKTTWRQSSKLEYIEQGLIKFKNTYKEKGIRSIAFPKLGCGNGGLNFEKDVKPLMDKYLSKLEDIEIYVYLDDYSTYIEHKNINEMRNWLYLNENISIYDFIQDLCDSSNGKITRDEYYNISLNDSNLDYLNLKYMYDIIVSKPIIKKEFLAKYLSSLIDNNDVYLFLSCLMKLEYFKFDLTEINNIPLIMYNPSLTKESISYA